MPVAVGLTDVLGLVRRRLWLIAGTAIALTLLAVAGLSQVQPRYSAKAMLLIDERAVPRLDLESVIGGLGGDPETVLSEIEILKSTRLADKVIQDLSMQSLPEFNAALRPPGLLSRLLNGASDASASVPLSQARGERVRVIGAFRNRLSVEPKPGSRVVVVKFSSQDPELAANVANRLAERYLQDQLESKFEAVQRASGWLDERVAELRETVQESESRVARYREESGLLEGGGTTLTDQQVAALNADVVDAAAARAAARARLDQVQRLLGSSDGAASIGEVLDSPLIQRLREQQVGVLRQIAELSTEFGERHPTMLKLRADAADLEAKIDTEIAKIVAGLESDLRVARGRERAARAELDAAKERVGDDNRALVTLRSLQREADANRMLLENMLARFTETSAQDDIASQRPDARIIAEALIPGEPSFPMTKAILALAMMTGAFMGLMLAFLRELTDGALRSGEQLEAATGLRALAFVPRLRRRERRAQSPARYLLDNPGSAYAESIRSVFASLRTSGAHESLSLLITSAQSGEGKSTIAACLARSLALAGKRVVIVDADCRRPSIAKFLGVQASHGLTDVLGGNVNLKDALVADESGADVLVAGDRNANLAALFASGRLEKLIKVLENGYDYIIIDSPPTMAVSDALLLSIAVDATMLVARWGETRREAVAHAARQLRDGGALLAGATLTMVDARKYARYSYGDAGAYTGKLRRYYHAG